MRRGRHDLEVLRIAPDGKTTKTTLDVVASYDVLGIAAVNGAIVVDGFSQAYLRHRQTLLSPKTGRGASS